MYLLTRSSPLVEGMLQELGAHDVGQVLLPNEEMGARLKVVPQQTVREILGTIPQRNWWILDSGAHLLGYSWPTQVVPGQSVPFATYWAFLDVPPAERLIQHSLFNHLLAPDGTQVAQQDGFGLSERYWDSGLVLVQWFELNLPPNLPEGDYTLLTGMYRLDNLQRNSFLDENGNQIGTAVPCGPLAVKR
ncbi:MAG: hypothetical protein A2Y73_06960 [Chloroflexi bacterium RBG_13_56_8]|nr:MAG: hypothetical protein A2Y73_06960 [Chloroflexi bacterium RBG_13_56_8]